MTVVDSVTRYLAAFHQFISRTRTLWTLSAYYRMQEQIRGTHWRDVAPCYPPPGLFARVIRGPVRSGVAGIRTLGFTTWSLAEIRYRSATSPRRCLCPAKVGGRGRRDSHFYLLLYYGRPRVYIQPWPFITASRENLEEVAPFCSVPPTVCIYTTSRRRRRRQRRWLLQEFPVDRYLREGIAAVWRGAQAARREGVVVRTRIFCLVHGSSETRRGSRCSTRETLAYENPRLSFSIIGSVSVTLYVSLRNLETEQMTRSFFLSRTYRAIFRILIKLISYHHNVRSLY